MMLAAAKKPALLRYGIRSPLLRSPAYTQRLFMSAMQGSAAGRIEGLAPAQARFFSGGAVVAQEQEEGSEVDFASQNARLGVDTEFSQQKHAYVLTFPWNFDEIIDEFQARHRPMTSGFWATYARNSGAFFEFNALFREFHQACARHDAASVEHVCEGKLAQAVNESLDRIHFHGLDVEMANLTVNQPSIQVLKVELSHGVSLERARNGSSEDWNVTKSSLMGAPCTYYTPVRDDRDWTDHIDGAHKPYCVAITALIESPMKLFVQNQNYSKILLGNDNEEKTKNVVRFEANMRFSEMFDLLPTFNKPPRYWKITDYNNLMNENPLF